MVASEIEIATQLSKSATSEFRLLAATRAFVLNDRSQTKVLLKSTGQLASD